MRYRLRVFECDTAMFTIRSISALFYIHLVHRTVCVYFRQDKPVRVTGFVSMTSSYLSRHQHHSYRMCWPGSDPLPPFSNHPLLAQWLSHYDAIHLQTSSSPEIMAVVVFLQPPDRSLNAALLNIWCDFRSFRPPGQSVVIWRAAEPGMPPTP